MKKVHILDEAISPPDSYIWTMWCGANCVVFGDGKLVPALDFVIERDTSKSTCEACKSKFKLDQKEFEQTKRPHVEV